MVVERLVGAEELVVAGAERLDSGELAERLADAAHAAAMRPVSSEDLRELAALALVLSRRLDAAVSD